jgi:hypothetical protein
MDPLALLAQVLSSPLLLVEVFGGLFLLTLIALVVVRRWFARDREVIAEVIQESRVGGRWSELAGVRVFRDGDAWMVLAGGEPVFLYSEPDVSPIEEAFTDLPGMPVEPTPIQMVPVVKPVKTGGCAGCDGFGKPEGAWGSTSALGKCLFNSGIYIFKLKRDCSRFEPRLEANL